MFSSWFWCWQLQYDDLNLFNTGVFIFYGNWPILTHQYVIYFALLFICGCSHVNKWFLLWSWRCKTDIRFCIPYVNMSFFRSSLPNVFCKTGVLRNFAKFTEKSLSQSLFFNKVVGAATLFNKRLWHRYFPVKFSKFLRTHFLTEHLRLSVCHQQGDLFFKHYLPKQPSEDVL